MKFFFLVVCVFLYASLTNGQNFNSDINKDSLFQELVKKLPDTFKDSVIQSYNKGNDSEKTFLLFILSLPRSSKKELIENYTKNEKIIQALPQKYSELVPDSLFISIEFNEPNKLLVDKETIDIWVSKANKTGPDTLLSQDWGLDADSDKFQDIISSIGWDMETIETIKQLLKNANCVSIQNGDITTIGFARSGLGKYYYKIFKNALTEKEIENYNDNCMFIYYKDNIVLEYGGGAIGPQCFPDEK